MSNTEIRFLVEASVSKTLGGEGGKFTGVMSFGSLKEAREYASRYSLLTSYIAKVRVVEILIDEQGNPLSSTVL